MTRNNPTGRLGGYYSNLLVGDSILFGCRNGFWGYSRQRLTAAPLADVYAARGEGIAGFRDFLLPSTTPYLMRLTGEAP